MKAKVFPIALLAIIIASCSSGIPTNVEPSVMKDVYPIPIDTLNNFLDLQKDDALRKIVSYGYVRIKQDGTSQDYGISGYRGFDNYVMDYIQVSGDKKETNSVAYHVEFGTTEQISDMTAYSEATKAAQASGESIVSYEETLAYLEKIGSDYTLKSGKQVSFKEGRIKMSLKSDAVTVTAYEDMVNMLKVKPYTFSCEWQSDDYSLRTGEGAKISFDWANTYAGPFSVTITEY